MQVDELKKVLFMLLIVVSITFPLIYLKNNIYYVSKDINSLTNKKNSLLQEQFILMQQLEQKEFENQINDSLIINDLKLISKELR